MPARVVDPAEVAARFREEVRADVATLTARTGATPRIVGLLSRPEGPARTYAQWAARGAADVGIDFVLRDVEPAAAADALREANSDPAVHGIFNYYPLADEHEDPWLRELVDPRKDVEGMHSFWSRMLYENRRRLDGGRRAILPCTPLAILKLLDDAGLRRSGEGAPLEGVTACVINRSDVVGRPLAAMLANDGAEVVSLDADGTVVFDPAIGRHAHSVRDSDEVRTQALARADVVVTGVPSRSFPLVTADEIKPGAICVNFSQFKNFDDSVLERAAAFIPRVGPMTVTMAMRNLVRLALL
ncbi:bifunctional methylenetetrahydrofolate dehydrogenase/methenyltetrahydrofolate cyclohydrolase [Terracoccus luteus]|uniref:Methylenetetrahydrofolate dehydrogenase (NADP+)/methenyltetrahydrofolate cyclohydrolase n=1 Tax=Terracoccus luteus TaxID=53356 RepID=A0A839PQ77_9MICO|nr:bifunctional methylenetetrahydrofolate dehydrogenase/methenyltetrahydrofolate cyclohydrolase [Terracoccus luteus]MBB2985667.1 methylenetetrahydrofolate dehydrogenase (NADP+)/methenyltetrahydrofolate cyclohydrolase [Terracoccus luteus]MCP2171319.1 methylenetetrahydrofolate dehydrogenase (NADP+)/methenyltetrahydrofolate cyclohydrolase [Terracoccus luteus]